MAAAAGADPEVLRLENLDTDLAPPAAAIEATRAAVGQDAANSYLPFTGRDDLKEAVAAAPGAAQRRRARPPTQVTITCGDGDNMLDALLAVADPGDEVIVTDPVYAGMLNRVRLAGAVPRLVPLRVAGGAWRLDVEALRAAAGPRTRAVFLMNPSFPSGALLSRRGVGGGRRGLPRARPVAPLLVADGGDRVRRRAGRATRPRSRAWRSGRSRSARCRWSGG